jgi:hypothetical protein
MARLQAPLLGFLAIHVRIYGLLYDRDVGFVFCVAVHVKQNLGKAVAGPTIICRLSQIAYHHHQPKSFYCAWISATVYSYSHRIIDQLGNPSMVWI